MTHKAHMVMDFQWGSTGKGLIAGYMAKREDYDTVVCAFAVNAGHTYIDSSRGIHVMTQQIPTGAIASPTVKNVLIGPGSLIHGPTFQDEIEKYAPYLVGKTIMVHPHAAVIEEYHTEQEVQWAMSNIGSTVHGVGAAAIERIRRNPNNPNTAYFRWKDTPLARYVVTVEEYQKALQQSESTLIEGAQGFGLSMYHGFYPYTTSRDVTPWQIAADCGLPYNWASYIQVIGSTRCFPIRVNNRTGSSGPHYDDQDELSWGAFADQGIVPEVTTVTKLRRRIFTFSEKQIKEALFHCGGYWDTKVFLNFANYTADSDALNEIIKKIERPVNGVATPTVAWLGFGADDADVIPRREYTERTGGTK